MADIPTGTATEIPEFPMSRAPGCPFVPPPKALALNAAKPLSRVRIWDGSTPWLIAGYDAIRALFTDARTSVDDRLPGYPHWNEGMLATVLEQVARRPPRAAPGGRLGSAVEPVEDLRELPGGLFYSAAGG